MIGANADYIDLVCQRLEALNHTWSVDQLHYIPSDAELVKLYRKAQGKNPKLRQYAVVVNKAYYEQDAQGRDILPRKFMYQHSHVLVVMPEGTDNRNFFTLKEVVHCLLVDNYDPKLGGVTLRDKNDPIATKKSKKK